MSAPPPSLLEPRPRRMQGFVLLSVALHAVVLVGVALLGTVERSPRVDLDSQPIKATLVRLGKERDQRLLPRKEQLPPPVKEAKAVPTPTPAPVPLKSSIPIPGEKPPEKAAPRPSLSDAFSKISPRPEELEGAEDGDPLGDSAVQEGERYFGFVRAQVRRYYDVSQTLSESERMHLRAVVKFRIDRVGAIVGEPSLVLASGNALFDSAVLTAVKKASPFGPPPDHVRGELQMKGFDAEFRP